MRRRLRERLGGRSARWLALETGYEEKNVQRYISGQSTTIPADFIGACEAKGFASARWLLLEEGSPDPVPPSDPERRLEVIRQLLTLGLRLASEAELEDLEAFLDTIPWDRDK